MRNLKFLDKYGGYLYFVLIVFLSSASIYSYKEEQDKFVEDFDYPDGTLPNNWWSEGCSGQIKDGHLFVNADTASYRMSTIWLDKTLSGNFSVEFDVQVISSEDTANNINCFLLYSDPKGKDLKETSKERSNGLYKRYHELNGFIFTYLANSKEDSARFRFRGNPGFQLLQENFGYECKKGKTYNIQIIKRNNQFQYWVDGHKMLDKIVLNKNFRYEKGLFGFRTWHTTLWWDNLEIKKLK